MPTEVQRPKVSVVMSVYNGEPYLREAIESILNQTFTDFEFLIINDGSTDSSRDIILSYNDPRIRPIDNEANLGLPVSLNKGIRLAKGEYIARQDADDVSLPERLELQASELDVHSSVGVVGCWWHGIDLDGRIFDKVTVPTEGQLLLQRMLRDGLNPSPHGSMMMRKEIVHRVGDYDERFWFTQDFDLWLRMWPHTDFVVFPSFLYQLRKLPRENRFKELCQTKYFYWAVKQFKDGQRHEFEDVREYVLHTFPEAATSSDYSLARYWAVLGSMTIRKGHWRLGLFYSLRILHTGKLQVLGTSLVKLLLAGVRRIMPGSHRYP